MRTELDQGPNLGRDRPVAAVAEAGGRFVVQDEATSVVWGMPGAAARTGRAEAVLPLSRIGEWLKRAAA